MKKIFITGAGQRIGLFLSQFFLEKGYTVFGTIRKTNPEIELLKQNKLFIPLIKDFEKDQLDNEFWKNFINQYGALYGFIHSASTFQFDDAKTVTFDNLDIQYKINSDVFIKSAASYYQCVNNIRNTIDKNENSIVNNSINNITNFITLIDQKIERINPDHFSYTISKLQLASVIPYLAQTLAPYIKVNAISPGLTLPSGEQNKEDFEKVRKSFPFKYGSDPIDLAETINFLMLQKSITGQIITVDAGQHLISDRDIILKDFND